MEKRTWIALGAGLFNALWLAHVFWVLGFEGFYPIRESVSWIAWGEFVSCLIIAFITAERMVNFVKKSFRP